MLLTHPINNAEGLLEFPAQLMGFEKKGGIYADPDKIPYQSDGRLQPVGNKVLSTSSTEIPKVFYTDRNRKSACYADQSNLLVIR